MRAVVHLDRAEEHAEIFVLDFFVQFSDDQLKLFDPYIGQLNVLDEDPIARLRSLRNCILDRLVQTLAHLEVMQLSLVRSDGLLVEDTQFLKHVDAMRD